MNCKINVDTKSLLSDCSGILNETDASKTVLKEIDAALSELERYWDGPASEEFMKKARQSLSDTECAVNAMCGLHANMMYALKTYTDCSDEAMNIVLAAERSAAI